MKHIVILLLLVEALHYVSYGQDSVVVSQKNASLFSNSYIFYSDSTFKHFFWTDDGQVWYGKGKYRDKKKKRILFFEDPDTNTNISAAMIHYEANFSIPLRKRKKYFLSSDYYETTRKRKVFFVPQVKIVNKTK